LSPELHIGPLSGYVWFGPAVVVSALLAIVLGGAAARRMRTRRALGVFVIFSIGTVLAATLTPSREALMGVSSSPSSCDLSRIGPASWSVYTRLDDASLNVLLFLPLGVSIALLPPSRLWAALVLGAILLPFGVEALQLVATPLGRACQSGDVSDNLIGLAGGLGLGVVARSVSRRR
jgi:glycopeptide antibiotics resistance protein